jgi:uncharacterized repeat protein (TIGR01451 family)
MRLLTPSWRSGRYIALTLGLQRGSKIMGKFLAALACGLIIYVVGAQAQADVARPQVTLVLSAERQVVGHDSAGHAQISWEAVDRNAATKPGEVIRYTVSAKNVGAHPAAKLSIVEPVPGGTRYVENSAKSAAENVTVSYSLDHGKSYSVKPMLPVKLPNGTSEMRPAPVSSYTNVRYAFSTQLQSGAATSVSYEVVVR